MVTAITDTTAAAANDDHHDDAAKTLAEGATTFSTSSYLSSMKSSRFVAKDVGSKPFAVKLETERRSHRM